MASRTGRGLRRLVAIAVAGTVTACTGWGGDKAGGPGAPVVLSLANGYSNLSYEPSVARFVERVEQVSNGALRVRPADGWGGYAPDFEQRITRDVASGRADLGWVGTGVFDTLGVDSFQALTAPLLVDSYALEQVVIDSEVPRKMLVDLGRLGVVGVAVLPGGLRKPIAVRRPLLAPADWQGITFQTFRSRGRSRAISALGAVPSDAFGSLNDGIVRGEIQGFDKSLLALQINAMAPRVPYVTANVNLWPQPVALLANPDRLAGLTDRQRGWLQRAALDAAAGSAALADRDVQLVAEACASGARFTDASAADIEALRSAFEPLYRELSEDPTTKTAIERLRQLRQTTTAEPPLVIPPGCTGPAPAAPSPA
ncbi:TRAP transporter substrate-binding protein [Dactylosporangium sp. CS-047395]|uniref:TRAP transporter substrate-binding protein n=1 Tax=Dactylosporangium sp. CS-047395 TaxID=3239936 RepID=UPI003D8CDED9